MKKDNRLNTFLKHHSFAIDLEAAVVCRQKVTTYGTLSYLSRLYNNNQH